MLAQAVQTARESLTRQGYDHSPVEIAVATPDSLQLRVSRRLTYAQVDDWIARPQDSDAGMAEALEQLRQLASQLRTARQQRGAVQIRRPEVKVKVRDGHIEVQPLDPDSPAREMVAEFMILANQFAAEYALRHDVPVIYRVQDPPDTAPPAMTRYDPVAFDQAVRHLKKTRLSTHPQPHAGLGLDLYTQVSSPIRRYADLVIQRQLAASLANSPLPYTVTELIEVLAAAESVEKQNRQIERDASQYWILEYLRRGPADALLPGTIVPERDSRLLVELDGLLVRGRLAATSRSRPGDRVWSRLCHVDPERGLLTLTEVPAPDTPPATVIGPSTATPP